VVTAAGTVIIFIISSNSSAPRAIAVRHAGTWGRGGICTVGGLSAVTGPGLLRSARGDDLIRRRAKASAGLRSAADDGKVDVYMVGHQSLWREMLVWSGGRRDSPARLAPAALNRCDGRPVLLGWSSERSRGARCRSAETLRTVRPGMAGPELRGSLRR
jgi:hypothetical protein